MKRKPVTQRAPTAELELPPTKRGTTALTNRATKRGSVGARSRKKPAIGRAEKIEKEKEWSVPLMLDRDELVTMLQDCLTDFATEVGLKVACLLFEKQVDIGCKRTTSGRRRAERRLSVSAKKR
jgi:hypothetical protein